MNNKLQQGDTNNVSTTTANCRSSAGEESAHMPVGFRPVCQRSHDFALDADIGTLLAALVIFLNVLVFGAGLVDVLLANSISRPPMKEMFLINFYIKS